MRLLRASWWSDNQMIKNKLKKNSGIAISSQKNEYMQSHRD